MMRNSFIYLSFVVLLATNFSLDAYSKDKKDSNDGVKSYKSDHYEKKMSSYSKRASGKRSRESWRGLIFKELDLNKKQRNQMITLKRKEIDKRFKMDQKRRSLRHQLHMNLMKLGKKVNDKKINEIVKKLSKIEAEKIRLMIDKIKSMKKILTKDQQKTLMFEMMWNGPRKDYEMR